MSGTMATVVDLDRAVTRLREARERLEGIPDWMRELHERHRERKLEIESVSAALAEQGQLRRTAAAEVEDGEVRLKRYQDQISAVRTQREYSALLAEIDTTKETIAQALATVDGSTTLEAELGEKLTAAEDGFASLEQEYAEAVARWEAEKPDVAAEAAQLATEIERLRSALTAPVLALYDRTRERYPTRPLATLRHISRPRGPVMHSCTACNYRVRPQSVVTLQRLVGEQVQGSEVVLCDGCRRILYLEAAE